MRRCLFAGGLLFALCLCANADTFPIIDIRYGYLIGAIKSGKWIEPTDATNSVKAGAKLPVYGVKGSVGNVSIVKLNARNEPCPDRPVVKLNPRKMKHGEVAFSPSWNPLPRKPKPVDVNQKQHVDVVREFLRQHGLRDPVVHINQIVSVDLDGDGKDGFVISATHYKSGDEIPDENFISAEGKHVIILGGGDTGADCLGTAHRQGALSVSQFELLPEPPKERTAEMPWP